MSKNDFTNKATQHNNRLTQRVPLLLPVLWRFYPYQVDHRTADWEAETRSHNNKVVISLDKTTGIDRKKNLLGKYQEYLIKRYCFHKLQLQIRLMTI